MLATIMNWIYVSEIFRSEGLKTNILTPFECGSMTSCSQRTEPTSILKKAWSFAGGTGHPYFSTDTGNCASCDSRMRMRFYWKGVDGIYDSDPKINPQAKKYDKISIQEVVDKQLGVIDTTASVMCMENKMPLMVFGLNEDNSILNAMTGKFNGTVVTVD